MVTPSPFPFLDDLAARLGAAMQPPAWVVEEVQRRAVLLVNHVLMQEPEAQGRLARQSGRVMEARWRVFVVRLAATPAGLLELAPATATPDLSLTVTEESAWALGQAALRGEKPPVRIVGDVQFAAEINWLVDHVRWDLEDDLARLVGDGPAHAIGQAVRGATEALRAFLRGERPGTQAAPPTVPAAAPATTPPPAA